MCIRDSLGGVGGNVFDTRCGQNIIWILNGPSPLARRWQTTEWYPCLVIVSTLVFGSSLVQSLFATVNNVCTVRSNVHISTLLVWRQTIVAVYFHRHMLFSLCVALCWYGLGFPVRPEGWMLCVVKTTVVPFYGPQSDLDYAKRDWQQFPYFCLVVLGWFLF